MQTQWRLNAKSMVTQCKYGVVGDSKCHSMEIQWRLWTRLEAQNSPQIMQGN
jgi:hypothetical protein